MRMDASVTTRKQEPDARAEALVASYERAGYARVAPAMLQPAEPFLDLSGEDIRRRMVKIQFSVSRRYREADARGTPQNVKARS